MGRKARLCSKKYRDWPKKRSVSSTEQSNVQPSAEPNVEQDDKSMSNEANYTDHKVSIDYVLSDLELPPSWNVQTTSDTCVRFYKLVDIQSTSSQPLKISHAMTLHDDLTWSVFVHNHKVKNDCLALSSIPHTIYTRETLSKSIRLINSLQICAGHPEKSLVDFCKAKKGNFISRDGKIKASIDSYLPVSLNGEFYVETIRSTKCEILVNGSKCVECKDYRRTIRLLHNRWLKKSEQPSTSDSSSCHINDRYLSTPEKIRKIDSLRKRVRKAELEVKKLIEKVSALIDQAGRDIDEQTHSDLTEIMNNESEKVYQQFPEGSFARVFWDQQLANAQKKGPHQYRWHPLIIKWCLNMRLMSGSSYHGMRTAGFITLPSERTLRDYTNYIEAAPGLQFEILEQMKKDAKTDDLPASRKYVTIIIDEMKIKEDLVFNKHTGEMLGFVNLGSINDELAQAEAKIDESEHPPIADHILAIMVRGLFFKLEFPLAHFPTRGCTAETLYPIIWDAVRLIESTGLKVIAITADGASSNRRFFRMHKSGDKGLVYKTKNIYAEDNRSIYFISDPPHLVKTIRNCWSHSYGKNCTREMFVNGKSIEWQHLVDLYEKIQSTSVASHGLSILPKLKLEHVQLNSFSRMRVDLAAQALSKSVADALQYYGDPRTAETERFVRAIDRFFDCLNVRSVSEWTSKRKPDKKPYTSSTDERFQWLKDEFLKYIIDWEKEAKVNTANSAQKYHHFTLSTQTLDGIKITVYSFIELATYLLSKHKKDNLFILSERLSQDPLENYFGQQRARGRRSENPTVQQCLQNANALRMQRSHALHPVRGNCRRKRQLFGEDDMITESTIDSTPLPKRKRHSKK